MFLLPGVNGLKFTIQGFEDLFLFCFSGECVLTMSFIKDPILTDLWLFFLLWEEESLKYDWGQERMTWLSGLWHVSIIINVYLGWLIFLMMPLPGKSITCLDEKIPECINKSLFSHCYSFQLFWNCQQEYFSLVSSSQISQHTHTLDNGNLYT